MPTDNHIPQASTPTWNRTWWATVGSFTSRCFFVVLRGVDFIHCRTEIATCTATSKTLRLHCPMIVDQQLRQRTQVSRRQSVHSSCIRSFLACDPSLNTSGLIILLVSISDVLAATKTLASPTGQCKERSPEPLQKEIMRLFGLLIQVRALH